MSVRLSTGLPRACSGDMYAAVPRMMPCSVIAGEVIVGDCDRSCAAEAPDAPAAGSIALARPEIEDLDRAVRTHFHVGGFQIAMDDAELVRGLEGVGDLAGDGEDLVDR